MSSARVVYYNWIFDVGTGPALKHRYRIPRAPEVSNQLIRSVRRAVSTLTPREREFVYRYYYNGEANRKIAIEMGLTVGRIDRLHRRILKRLKIVLADFVRKEYGLDVAIGDDCPICQSPHCDEINRLIQAKPPEVTWRGVLKTLCNEYGLKITSPQVLIGHEKYHMNKEGEHGRR
ncbi:MAG: sigma-70 family RNA polymerase sigma factor [candidate division Zixibacteria bacterium]|nr:sigma-70 family RNA polymerase sigma factor [candidate division Zixibacteria bacterium]